VTVTKNIIITKFQDFVLDITLYDIGIYDLTGITACLQIKRNYTNTNYLISLTTENYGITLGGVSGTIDLFIDASITGTLPTMDAYYDLLLIYPDDTKVYLMEGTASIIRDTSGGVTVDNQSQAIASLFPRGRAWDNVMTIGTNLNNLCRALSETIIDFKNDVYKLYKEIYYSTHTSLTNDLRLVEYGLPNTCDPLSQTLELLENGLDTTQTRVQIIEQAMPFLGIDCTVIDEIVNDIPKTLSVIIDSSSDIFGDCLQAIGGEECDIYTGDASCTDIMYAGSSPYQFIPNLDCVFKQVVPLGWNIGFYLDTKDAPLFIGN
jgi:hypothetical protein